MLRVKRGFTIVELLIVVVVIAILASITIVAYNGIRGRADASAVQSELSSVGKKLQASKIQSGVEQFPLTLGESGVSGTSSTISYSTNVGSGRTDYCATATKGTISYYISSRTNAPKEGSCAVTDGLVGWWQFNGNANDSSSGGNTGVVTNATLAAGQNDVSNAAYSFNGTSAYITANTPTMERTSFAATLWFRTSSTADRKLISTTGGGAHIIQIMSPNGVLRSCINACALGTRNFADGRWHFVAAVGTTSGMYVYVDGESNPELVSSYTGTTTIGNQIRIGAEYTPSFFFGGQIDDVRIYNRSLLISEAQTLFSAGAQ